MLDPQEGVNPLKEVRKPGTIFKVLVSGVRGFSLLKGIPLITRADFGQGILASPEEGWAVEELQYLEQLLDGTTEVDVIEPDSDPDREYTFLPETGSSPVVKARDATKTTVTELILELQKSSAILAPGAVWRMTDSKKANLAGYAGRTFETLWFDIERGIIIRPLAVENWPHLLLLPIDRFTKYEVLTSSAAEFQSGVNADTPVYDVEKRTESKAGEYIMFFPPVSEATQAGA